MAYGNVTELKVARFEKVELPDAGLDLKQNPVSNLVVLEGMRAI